VLIVYSTDTKAIVSISGPRRDGLELLDEDLVVELAEPLPPGKAIYNVYDWEIVDKIWRATDAGIGIHLQFEGDVPVGVGFDAPVPPPKQLKQEFPSQDERIEALESAMLELVLGGGV